MGRALKQSTRVLKIGIKRMNRSRKALNTLSGSGSNYRLDLAHIIKSHRKKNGGKKTREGIKNWWGKGLASTYTKKLVSK